MRLGVALPARRGARTIAAMRIAAISLLGVIALLAVAIGPAAAQDDAPDPGAESQAEQPAAGGTESGEPAEEVEGPPMPVEPPPPIYEGQLLRLSEILGALSFLRGLCGEPVAAAWRDEMSALLAAEQPGPMRRARLIGRFNHGFETFNAVYRTCTPSARRSISRYIAEGQALSGDVRSRYSQ